MEPAREEADRRDCEIVIACDPDADRIGVEVKRQGGWVHLTGNQIATILAYRLLLDPDGPQLRGGVYQTIVTSSAVRAIAEQAGCAHIVDDLLVGFKYIGAAVGRYSQDSPDVAEDDLLAFAAEESHGYLVTPRLRDKDALSAALYLARLHEDLRERDDDLVGYLARVYEQVGAFGDRGRSFSIVGSAGVAAIARAMKRLRDEPPKQLGGREVLQVVDYWNESPAPEGFGPFASATDREARNVLVFAVEDARVTLRPSGTEPKLKFYVSTSTGSDGAEAQAAADDLATAVYVDLAPLFDVDLSPAAARLPDVIAVGNKTAFDRQVLAKAEEVVARSEESEAAEWLRGALEDLIPGDHKVAIAAPALLEVAREWQPQARERLQAALRLLGHR
jgi:phosphomannomutase